MSTLIVSFLHQGAVSFLRESKKVSENEASKFIKAAHKDPVMGNRVFGYLPTGTTVNIYSKVIEHSCIRKLRLSSEQVESILNGGSPPSYFQQRQNKLSSKVKGRITFDVKKWKKLPEHQRLSIWLSDLMHDLQATSFAWEALQ